MLQYQLNHKPMESWWYDGLAMFNECVLWIVVDMLALFTDYIPRPEVRYSYGFLLIAILYFNFGVNLIMLAIESIRITKMHYKRYKLHKLIKKQRN